MVNVKVGHKNNNQQTNKPKQTGQKQYEPRYSSGGIKKKTMIKEDANFEFFTS